ncbi:MAG: outer membrane protein [Caulobacterales bacterium]
MATLIAAAVVFAAPGVRAETPPMHHGYYVSLKAGLAVLDKVPMRCPHGVIDPVLRARLGFGASAAAGYSFANGFRVEAEAPLRTNAIGSVTAGSASESVSGSITSVALMANLLYDINGLRVGRLTPYVGGGVGAAHVTADGLRANNAVLLTGASDRFAYQGIVGVSGDVTRSWSVDLDYRYFATADPKFKTASGDSVSARYETQSVMLGGTYHFSQ